MQPQWSPDGRTIAFASDRGPQTDFDNLKFSRWQISLYDLESGRVSVLPNQAGQNLNPMWAPDGKSIAFVSDRTGIPNIFIYDLEKKQHYPDHERRRRRARRDGVQPGHHVGAAGGSPRIRLLRERRVHGVVGE